MGKYNGTDQLDTEIEAMEKALTNREEPEAEEIIPVEEKAPIEQEAELDEELEKEPVEDEDTPVELEEDLTKEPAETEDIVVEKEEVEEDKPKAVRVNWKKRYITYKASTDPTIFKLRTDLSEAINQKIVLEQRINELDNEVLDLQTKAANAEDLFSEEERDVLGDEAVTSIQKAVDRISTSKISKLEKQLEKERELRVQAAAADSETKAQQAHSDFRIRLQGLVPNLEELNTDDKFFQHMDGIDSASGYKRIDLLRQAESYGDVARVADFFQDYNDMVGNTKATKIKNLEEEITPQGQGSNSSNKASSSNSSAPSWTVEKINKFYDDINRGKYKNKEELALKIESQIDDALAKGEIS